MKNQRAGRVLMGVILILLGGVFLVGQLFPGLKGIIQIELSWPWIIIGVGAFLFLFGLLVGAPGMAVPASIVGGIGLLLYWQNATGNWDSWSYAWTLIPGFVGVGILLEGLLSGRFRQAWSGGGTMLIISVILFVIFSSFMGGPVSLGVWWPLLLILLGLWMLGSMLWGRNRQA